MARIDHFLEHHPLVSKHELTEINDGKLASSLKAEECKDTIPYLEILTTPSVWGVWIGALGDLIAIQVSWSLLYCCPFLALSDKSGYRARLSENAWSTNQTCLGRRKR